MLVTEWHTLYHTFASPFDHEGRAARGGPRAPRHSSIEMTMRYAHLSPDTRADEDQLLDDAGIKRAEACWIGDTEGRRRMS